MALAVTQEGGAHSARRDYLSEPGLWLRREERQLESGAGDRAATGGGAVEVEVWVESTESAERPESVSKKLGPEASGH